MDAKILEQVKTDEAEWKANLQYLADHMGPRLTGSPQLKQASEWTRDMFQKYGFLNVRLEPWTIANGWARGTAAGRVIAPAPQMLTLAAAGWSPSTNGTLRGLVTGIAVEKPEDLEQYKGKLKGAIVLVGRPAEMVPPQNRLLTPWVESTIPVAHPKSDTPFDFQAYIRLVRAESEFFSQEKVGAVLFASEKAYGLLNMISVRRDYQPGFYPAAVIPPENPPLLLRTLDAGPVEAEINIQNAFNRKPVEGYNTLPEIPGRQKPDKMVIIRAHPH